MKRWCKFGERCERRGLAWHEKQFRHATYVRPRHIRPRTILEPEPIPVPDIKEILRKQHREYRPITYNDSTFDAVRNKMTISNTKCRRVSYSISKQMAMSTALIPPLLELVELYLVPPIGLRRPPIGIFMSSNKSFGCADCNRDLLIPKEKYDEISWHVVHDFKKVAGLLTGVLESEFKEPLFFGDLITLMISKGGYADRYEFHWDGLSCVDNGSCHLPYLDFPSIHWSRRGNWDHKKAELEMPGWLSNEFFTIDWKNQDWIPTKMDVKIRVPIRFPPGTVEYWGWTKGAAPPLAKTLKTIARECVLEFWRLDRGLGKDCETYYVVLPTVEEKGKYNGFTHPFLLESKVPREATGEVKSKVPREATGEVESKVQYGTIKGSSGGNILFSIKDMVMGTIIPRECRVKDDEILDFDEFATKAINTIAKVMAAEKISAHKLIYLDGKHIHWN